MGTPQNFPQRPPQLAGSQGAVQPDHICPQARQRHRRRSRVGPQEGAPVLPEGHGHENRQMGVLLRRQQRRLGLQQVAHGLDEHQVRSRRRAGLHDLREHAVGLCKGHVSEGLQHAPQRAHVQSGVCPGCRPRPLRQGDARGNAGPRVLPQLPAAGPEGVGGDDVRPRLGVGAVDALHHVRRGDIQPFGALAGRQTGLLEHTAHASVKEMVLCQIDHVRSTFLSSAQKPQNVPGGTFFDYALGCALRYTS